MSLSLLNRKWPNDGLLQDLTTVQESEGEEVSGPSSYSPSIKVKRNGLIELLAETRITHKQDFWTRVQVRLVTKVWSGTYD